MKGKKIGILIMFLFTLLTFKISNANVDVTNSFGFTYDCNSNGINGGVLHTTFNLGGHHSYNRDYKINNPGIIEIADANHTTTSKNLNVSISGCNYKPSSCNISSTGTWIENEDNIDFALSIISDGDIIKNNNIINISGTKKDDKGKNQDITNKVIYQDKEYVSTGKDIDIELSTGNIKIDGKTVYYFSNRTYSGINEYYYNISSDQKNIELRKKTFKRTNTGNILSSTNTYDEFEAYQGTNTDNGYGDNYLLSDKNGTSGGYPTGLNFWDYTQHYYTTTKVKIYPVNIGCEIEEFSDGTKVVTGDEYEGTLAGVVNPSFSGPIKINGECQKLNGNCSTSSNGSIKIFATGGIVIDGLNYTTVGEIGGNKLGIDGVEFTLKKDQITYMKKKINITKKDTPGDIGDLIFSSFDYVNGTENLLKKPGVYGIELIFYSGESNIGTYALPLSIVPNYNYTKSGNIVSLNPGEKFANNSDYYSFCQNITDEFGNSYSDFGNIDMYSNKQFYIDQINNTGDGLYTYNNTFNSSKICFNIKSYSPGSSNITFTTPLTVYDTDGKILSYKQLSFSENITFKRPFTTSDLSIVNANKKLEIGPSLNMGLTINKLSNLSTYTINDFSDNITLGDTTNHEFKKFPIEIDANNLKYSFTIDAKTDNGIINIAPSIILNQNPIISYSLDGKNIKYYVNKSTNPTDNTKLSLNGVKGISGIKVVGNSQTTGKSAATNNIVKFTDLSKSSLRSTVKKNVSILTKGLSAEKLVNGVIYFNGDKKISEISNLSSIETLIIKNGNLIIDQNINKEKFGIIVTRDDNNKTNLGNIYVIPGITYIKASIYADGGLVSIKSSSEISTFNIDTDDRTNTLNKQLVIKGSILTRNTIGGAVKGSSGKYILPGGELTDNFDKAMMYDLNYIRRGNGNQDSTKNGGNNDNLVIIYNSSIQTNPPKGFSSN